jgi:hypothetical protein
LAGCDFSLPSTLFATPPPPPLLISSSLLTDPVWRCAVLLGQRLRHHLHSGAPGGRGGGRPHGRLSARCANWQSCSRAACPRLWLTRRTFPRRNRSAVLLDPCRHLVSPHGMDNGEWGTATSFSVLVTPITALAKSYALGQSPRRPLRQGEDAHR